MKVGGRYFLLVAVVIGALLWIYAKSDRFEIKQHDQFQRELHSLQTLDATLTLNVLEVRFGLLGNYDSLAAQLNSMEEAVRRLQIPPSFVHGPGAKALELKRRDFSELLKRKSLLVESFKSSNAILNNSLHYLPRAHQRLQDGAAPSSAYLQVEPQIEEVFRGVLLFCLNAEEDAPVALGTAAHSLAEWAQVNANDPRSSTLALFASHANSILTRKPLVERVTRELVGVPTGVVSEELAYIYQQELANTLEGSNQLRRELNVGCLVLLLTICGAFYSIARAKGSLETRVQERTRELSETNRRFEIVTSATTNVIWDWDLREQTIEWNENFTNVFGYSGDKIGCATESWTQRIHPEDRVEVLRSIYATINGASTLWSGEYRFLRCDNTWATVFDRGSVVRDERGRPLRMIGAMEDITVRRGAEEALRASERRYRDLMQSLPAAVYTCNPQGRITFFNSAAAHLWGREPRLGVDLWCGSWRIFTPAGRMVDPSESPMAVSLREGRAAEGQEMMVERPNGERSYVLPHPHLIRDEHGQVIEAVNMLVDLSQRRQAEQKLDELNRQLLKTSRAAGMAEVATNVLHNVGNVLNSVNVSATLVSDAARKSKVEDVAKVVTLLDQHAEDLGTYFTGENRGKALTNYLRELGGHLVREKQTSLVELDLLRGNLEHIKDIVAMQQNYAKVSGVSELLNITDLVEDSLRMNAGALTRHQVSIKRDYQEIPKICVEKHKVLQILVNLIRNAKHACDEGGAAEKLLTLRVANGGSSIRISVTDNGIGVPIENMVRIFNHGFTTRKEGHGFGLHGGAIAAKELGGALLAYSDGAGTGATFTLELPLDPPPQS